jgi:hypothetical protein
MAEVGLVSYAKGTVALGRAVVPAYRNQFSPHQLTPLQVQAILCLMRSEDGTCRETGVRLADYGLLAAFGDT